MPKKMFNGSMESPLSKCVSRLLLAIGGEKRVEKEGAEGTYFGSKGRLWVF